MALRTDSNLTRGQLMFWAAQRVYPEIPLYNAAHTFILHGDVDEQCFRAAFQALVDGSDAFRTVFIEEDGAVRQHVLPEYTYTVETYDLSGSRNPRDALRAWAQARFSAPFDLTQPSFESVLLRLGPQLYAWYFSMHHICGDAWSTELHFKRLSSLYERALNGQLDGAPSYPSYTEYVQHDNELRASAPGQEAQAYWAEKLKDGMAPLAFYGRPSRSPLARVERREYDFGAERTRRLKELLKRADLRCGSDNATLFNILFSVLAAYLHRIAGSTRVSIGMPYHNRREPQFRETAGLLLEVLPVRVNIDEGETFLTLYDKVVTDVKESMRHRPFSMQNRLDERAYEVILNYHVAGFGSFAGMRAEQELLHPGHALERLVLHVHDFMQRGELSAYFDFDCDVFEQETRRRAMEHFTRLLDAFIEDPARPIALVDILTEEERRHLVEELNQTRAPFPHTSTIHELVEAQAARKPDAPAVMFRERTWTFAELNAGANLLARRLREHGVGPERIVGLYVERGLDMPLTALAVLKAGGAFMPLDPEYPAERIAFMLEDSGASLIVTRSGLAKALPSDHPPLLILDETRETPEAEDASNLPAAAGPGSLAYVIYTSGSTGRPKGVMIEHRGMCNLMAAKPPVFRLDSESVALQFASFSFDMSVSDIFVALGAGAAVCIAHPEARGSDAELAKLVQERRVTHAVLTPTVLDLLDPEALPSLKGVVSGGESCHADLAHRWSMGRLFLNGYGPTETSACVSLGCYENGCDETPAIGRPINNACFYVLDGNRKLVPLGVPGELAVGGVPVGRGYLNRPDLTAERFIPNPFTDDGGMLYLTGDIVRYRRDGNLEYVGRTDSQIKIRGFRVELGEIENALKAHRAVRDAAVAAHEDPSGRKRLVAYIVGQHGHSVPSQQDLKRFLCGGLPEYMVPSHYEVLHALPLSANGKVDKDALPEPRNSHPEEEFSSVAPRNPVEKKLARIWADVLHLDSVSVHESFFDIGGDSLTSIQVIGLANREGINLTPHDFFRHHTIAELAALASGQAARESVISAEQDVVTGPVPLTPIQQWFFEAGFPNPECFAQAVLLDAPHAVNGDTVRAALGRILEHHDALRLRFVKDGASWRQFNADVGEPALVLDRDLTGLSEEQELAAIERVALELQDAIDLTNGPLLAAAVFTRGSGRVPHVLLILHHLASDGVSWPVFVGDLVALCEQLLKGETPSLPPKTTSFKEWAMRLKEYANSPQIRREEVHWLSVARRAAGRLPAGREHPMARCGQASFLVKSVGKDDTGTLVRELSATVGVQAHDLLVTAMVLSLTEWSGRNGVLIDMEGHGRETLFSDVDLSRTVGWFTSLYPAFFELPDGPKPGEALELVRGQLKQVPSRGIGFGVMKYLGENEDAAKLLRQIQPDISFNYLGEIDVHLGEHGDFRPANRWHGPFSKTGRLRFHPLEVNIFIADDQLQVFWSYGDELHDRETVERLASNFVAKVHELIVHCRSLELEQVTADHDVFSVVPVQPHGTKPPLFCVAPAGGVVFPYYHLVPLLEDGQPLYALQDPSLDPKHKPFKTIEKLAAHYIEAMRKVQPQGPYHVLGWSFGAVVAFEMAQQLRDMGERAAFVGMIDSPAPNGHTRGNGRSLLSLPKRAASVVAHVASIVPHVFPYIRDGLYLVFSHKGSKTDAKDKPSLLEFIRWGWRDAVWQAVAKDADMGGVVSNNERLLLIMQPKVRRVLQVLAANGRSLGKYKARQYPDEVVVFRAEQQLASMDTPVDDTMGWSGVAASVDVRNVPGNHVVFFRKPYIETFAQELAACLEKARKTT